MSRMLRAVAVVLALGALTLSSASSAAAETPQPSARVAGVIAGVDDFSFASMTVDYTLSRADDGTSVLDVVETFVAEFPETDQNRGMRRSIPDSYLGAPLRPEFESITDADGNPRPSEVDTDEGYFTMTSRADDFVHGEQTYVFRYRLHNVTRYFADTGVDEFYWQINGLESAQPYGTVSATLFVDGALADALTGDMACYRGVADSQEQCAITSEGTGLGGTVVSASASAIPPYETVTMSVAFAAGTFTSFDPSYLASGWGWAQGVAGLALVGAVAAAGVTRSRRLRDDPGRPTIIAEYEPPAGVDALESAVLLGKTTKAIPAEVLEQAVVGSVRIVEGEPRRWSGPKLTAVLVDPSLADGDGRLLLEGLFPAGVPGEEYEFGKSDTRLAAASQKILTAAARELKNRGLRKRVSGMTRAWPILLTAAAAALVVGFGIAALSASVDWVVPVVLMAAALLALIVVSIVMSRMPLTAKGAEVRDHLEGLRVFIEWAEADRIRMLQSPSGAERRPVDVGDPRVMLHLYERLLPYAVVFGQEKQWAQQLAVFYGDGGSPSWYAGSSGFNAAAFSAGIGGLSASAASSSSTSGGSSGGGSAGGGGGGGGAGGV